MALHKGLGGMCNTWVSSHPHHSFTPPQGLSSLYGLRQLKCAHNALSDLSPLSSWASALEVLDLGFNRLNDLAPLTCCVSLTELIVAGNALGGGNGLHGLSRCSR